MWGLGIINRAVILEDVKRRFPHISKAPRKVSVTPRCSGYLTVGILKGRETVSPPRCLKKGHKSITKALGRPDSEFSHTSSALRGVIIPMLQMKK